MPITNLSKYPLVHGLSFLPQSDLFHAARMNRRFERIVLSVIKQKQLKLIKFCAGESHAIALMENIQGEQQLYSWGKNDRGQLGLGHYNHQPLPTPIDMAFLDGANIKQITVNEYSCLIHAQKDSQDLLFNWGLNSINGLEPVPIHSCLPEAIHIDFLKGSQIQKIVSGFSSNFIHTKTPEGQEQLFSWGFNNNGELGLGNRNTHFTPQLLDLECLNDAQIVNIYTGHNHTFLQAQRPNGETLLFGCGCNIYGQLNLGHNRSVDRFHPVNLDFLNGANIEAIHVGSNHSLIHARTAADQEQLFSWGHNGNGQLGHGHYDVTPNPQPIDLAFLNGASIEKIVSSHNSHILHAHLHNGHDILFGWGYNECGQLGVGNNRNVNRPCEIHIPLFHHRQIGQIVAGTSQTFLTLESNKHHILLASGHNYHGQLSVLGPTKVNLFTLSDSEIFRPTLERVEQGHQRRNRRLIEKIMPPSQLIRQGLNLGFGSFFSQSLLPEVFPYQIVGSLIGAGISNKLLNACQKYQSGKLADSYHDPAIRKYGLDFECGMESATNTRTYLMSFTKVRDKKAIKEWRAGYAAGLIEADRKQRKLKRR